MAEETTPALSKDAEDVLSKVEKMSVLELNALVKAFEERFGVSAAAPMMMGAMPGMAAGGAAAEEEKTSVTVTLTNAGAQKINVIKVVREITGLGLKDAKDLVDGAPKPVKENIKPEEAAEMKKKIEEAGGQAEVK